MRKEAAALAVLALMTPLAGLSGRQSEIPDLPRQRWEFFYQQRAFPFNQIPPLAYQRAREVYEARWSGLFAPPPPPIQGTQWEPIGPERIPISATSTGRLSAIAIHPTNSSIIYIGGAQGGVWRTTDAGVSWTPLTDNECSLAMGSIAIDPDNPNIIYAGTGEQHFSADSYYGCGVLRSTDGGNSWTQLGTSVFQTAAEGARISRVVIDPETAGSPTATTVYAASDLGLFRSLNSGLSWTPLVTGLGEGAVTDLVLDPTDPDVMYAAVWDRFNDMEDGVYRSANGGTTWSRLGDGFPTGTNVGRINIDISAMDPQTLYASIHNDFNNGLAGIYRTQNAGASWTPIDAENASCGLQCWYDMEIAVHPTNPDTLYFGGVALYRSTDGGDTFEDITHPIHVDQHIIAFDPQNPDVMFVGNDGGVYRSNDAGENWSTLNTNLSLTQFYAGVSLHPTDPTIVLGGTQDNGTLEHEGTPDWVHVLGGDGGFTAIDQDDPSIRYAETQWVPNSGYSGPRKSVGGGPFNLHMNGIVGSDRALFIPPLVMDPTNSQTLYFGTFRLYRTTNSAVSWSAISPDLTGGQVISAIAVAPSDPDVIYVGASDGRVHQTANGGQNWTNVSGGLPIRHVKDIAVDHTDPDIAYVVFSGFDADHVYRTNNGGAGWQSISGDLPDVPVNAIILDPADPNRILIGSDLGVFSTDNGGANWVPFNQGLPNVAVFDLAYNPNTGVLLAATHGRGMFTVDMATPIALEVLPVFRADTVAEGETQISSDSADVRLFGTGAQSTTWTAMSGLAGSWLSLTTPSGTGSETVRWDRNPTGLAAGIYVDTITVTVPGAIDSPAEVIDSLHVLADIALTVSPISSSDSAPVGQVEVIPDSANVDFIGTGGEVVDWTPVASNGTWISVATDNETGPGLVRWERDPSALAIGTYVDTITVEAPGILGSPARIIDTLEMQPPLTLAVTPASIRVSAVEGQVDSLGGDATVTLTGFGADAAPWTATHGGGTWLSMRDAQGTGSGTVTWMRHLEGMPPGHYVDTITVTVAEAQGSPAEIVDTISVVTPLALEIDPLMRHDTVFVGDTAAVLDSVDIMLTGGDAVSAIWQASVENAPWIALTQLSGQGAGPLRWTRQPGMLEEGTHDATITVTVNGASGSPIAVVDRLVVLLPPITLEEAADALLNETALTGEQIEYLDDRGNRDGAYNLGDLLAYVERSKQSETTLTHADTQSGTRRDPQDRR